MAREYCTECVSSPSSNRLILHWLNRVTPSFPTTSYSSLSLGNRGTSISLPLLPRQLPSCGAISATTQISGSQPKTYVPSLHLPRGSKGPLLMSIRLASPSLIRTSTPRHGRRILPSCQCQTRAMTRSRVCSLQSLMVRSSRRRSAKGLELKTEERIGSAELRGSLISASSVRRRLCVL